MTYSTYSTSTIDTIDKIEFNLDNKTISEFNAHFLNIPKTGGMSINSISGVRSTLESGAHVPANAIEFPTKFFTVVRNPVDRIYSLYKFSSYNDFDEFLDDLEDPVPLADKMNISSMLPGELGKERKIIGDAIRSYMDRHPEKAEQVIDEITRRPLSEVTPHLVTKFLNRSSAFISRYNNLNINGPTGFGRNGNHHPDDARALRHPVNSLAIPLLTQRGPISLPGHCVANQWDYIENDKGHKVKIFYFGDNELVDYLGVSELPHKNQSNYAISDKEYDLTTERIDRIQSICHKDYEYLRFDTRYSI